MLDKINAQLKMILTDIRQQERIHRKHEVIDERIKLKKEELVFAERALNKADSVYKKLSKHSPRSAFFNLIGNRKKKQKEAKKRLDLAQEQRNQITSEITQILQETHKLRQTIEALEPLEKMKHDLIQLKEDYLMKNGNPELLNLTETIYNQKLDIKELKEAIMISIAYRKSLMVFIKKLERSLTWTHLRKCATLSRKLLKESEQLEVELMDVLNRMNIPIAFNPQKLGKLWVTNCQLLEWNYSYEYSQDKTLGKTKNHFFNVLKTINILSQHYKITQSRLKRNEQKRVKLLEET